jgi:hypothetical protein
MAKDKVDVKRQNKKAPVKGVSNAAVARMLLIFFVIAGLVFLPTTVLLLVGMLPTVAAFLASIKGNIARAYSVAATNFAGCFSYLIELWSSGHTFENSFQILINPISIIAMYSAAAFGYLLDWVLSGMVAAFIQQKGKSRLSAIKDRQKDMIEQWGHKVTGMMPLDEEGFPVKRD